MQARVVSVQIASGKIDEAVRIYSDSVAPAARDQPGLQRVLLLTDSSSGKGMSITIWESAERLAATESSGYLQEQFAKFASVFAAPPTREAFDVSVWEKATVEPKAARVVSLQVQPGGLAETIRIYRDDVLGAARQQRGFRGALLLTDPGAGKVISATAWDAAADIAASESSGYFQEQISKFASLIAGPPVRELYDINFRA